MKCVAHCDIVRLALCCTLFFMAAVASSQDVQGKFRLGFNYGIGKQSVFPFNNPDYSYENQFFKFQINRLLTQRGKFSFELNAEPGIYISKHQLLNMYYVQPNRGPDYLAQRERLTKLKTFNEYVLNVGLLTRYTTTTNVSLYFLASAGPMYGDTATERLAKGFAFSDVVALGASYTISKISFDLRFSLRHTSNADLYYPNAGHNSTCIEAGFLFQL